MELYPPIDSKYDYKINNTTSKILKTFSIILKPLKPDNDPSVNVETLGAAQNDSELLNSD